MKTQNKLTQNYLYNIIKGKHGGVVRREEYGQIGLKPIVFNGE
jgi:hypothetical protein